MNFNKKIILSPMAKVNDVAFRVLCRKYGADIVYSEMTNTDALLRGNEKTIEMTNTVKEEKPNGIQLFGTNLKSIAYGTKFVQDKCDVIDFNFGCPAPKITKQGAGSALMLEPKKVYNIVKTMVDNSSLPITSKIRAGYSEKNYLEVAKMIEKAGASAITIHPRTKIQGYSGKADWDCIKVLKENLSIPVIGNGDVRSKQDADKMFEQVGCDSIMIARGALGNPLIFQKIKGKDVEINKEAKINMFKEYLKLFEKYNVKEFAQAKMQALYFLKGFQGGAELRNKVSRAINIEEVLAILG